MAPVVKGYRFALNHIFALAGMDLAANRIISRMFNSFGWNCLTKKKKKKN